MGHIPAMSDLYGGCCSFFMDGIRYLFDAGNDFRAKPQLALEGKSALCDGCISKGCHAYTSGSNGSMVVVKHFRRGVAGAHAFECCRPYRTVSEC